jgi:hypothetical protein
MRDLSLLRGVVKEKLRGIGTEVPCVGIGRLIGDYIGYDRDISDLAPRQNDELAKRLHELWILGCLIEAWKSISPGLRIESYIRTWSCICENGNYELWWEYGKYHPTQQINVTANISELDRKCARGKYKEVVSDLGVEGVPENYRDCLKLVQRVFHKGRERGEKISENLRIRFQNVLNDNLWNRLDKPQSLHTVPDLTMFRRGTTQDFREIKTESLKFTEDCLLLIEAKHKPLENVDLKQFAFYVLFFKPKVSVLAVHEEARHEELNFVLNHLRGKGRDVRLMENFNIDRNLQMREETALKNLLGNLFR